MSTTLHETFADLVLDGPAGQPLDRLQANVLTIGSMSKPFWAGLRIGWIRADPTMVRRLAQLRGAQDLASPVLEQLVAAELLQRAEEILPERREQLRRGRDELTTGRPTRRCTPPGAGMVLWVELPEPGASRLAAHALDLGLRLPPARVSPSTAPPTAGSACRSPPHPSEPPRRSDCSTKRTAGSTAPRDKTRRAGPSNLQPCQPPLGS